MHMFVFPHRQKGITLVEVLIVTAVLAIVWIIAVNAINPLEQFAKSRNTKRNAGVNAIANALHQYTAQHGSLPPGISGVTTVISSEGADLCEFLIPKYLPALPQDPGSNNGVRIFPSDCGKYDTGYTIRLLGKGHFIIEAPNAELDTHISETR